jgi:hypothetical protein
VHTEDAVGRHRLEAIESSVVRPLAMVGTREVKATGWKSAKAVENLAKPNRSEVIPATGYDDGKRILAQEDGGQGALTRPERDRGSIHT